MIDGLKISCFDRGLSPQYARPRTPPRSSSTNMASPPGTRVTSPPREPYSYSSILTQGVEGWSEDQAGDDEDDEDDEDEIVYDDDEDEFGLPSIASMRRKKTKGADNVRPKNIDPGGWNTSGHSSTGLNASLASGRQRANSSDIAEERGAPLYPTTGKGEGKILRPQYKDILKGNVDLRKRNW